MTRPLSMAGQEQEPKEEYIMIVDADNIMRFPFDPVQLRVEPGTQFSPHCVLTPTYHRVFLAELFSAALLALRPAWRRVQEWLCMPEQAGLRRGIT